MQKIRLEELDNIKLSPIAEEVSSGKIIVMPSDTIYGIFTSALNKDSVEKIYELRKRNKEKALIILISDVKQLTQFNIKLSEPQGEFLKTVWPGAISVILECADSNFDYLHRGLNSLAFRLPDNEFLIKFLKISGPLVAPSANIEGEKPSEIIEEAENYFGDKIDYYIDGGKISGDPSTVVKLDGKGSIEVIREGKVKLNA